MNFETSEITAFELEMQVVIENSSLEKKAFHQILNQMSGSIKEHGKALDHLNKMQKKEWKMLSKEIQNQKEAFLAESQAKILSFDETIKRLAYVISQEVEKTAQTRPAQPIRPGGRR